jgi:transcriptional regulator with XRE-family HTH domain
MGFLEKGLSLGGRIRLLRENSGLTQIELADLIKVSHKTIVSYEKDTTKHKLKTLVKIAQICSGEEFMGYLCWLLNGPNAPDVDWSAIEKEYGVKRAPLEELKDIEADDIIMPYQHKKLEEAIRDKDKLINTQEKYIEKLESELKRMRESKELNS